MPIYTVPYHPATVASWGGAPSPRRRQIGKISNPIPNSQFRCGAMTTCDARGCYGDFKTTDSRVASYTSRARCAPGPLEVEHRR